MDKTEEPETPSNIREIKLTRWDTLWAQKNKLWLIKAVDRGARRTVTWGIGGRDAASVQRLYEKVNHLKNCTFYTDD